MAKGVPLNEIDFAMIDRALMRGMSRSEAAKATGFGFKTVSLVEEAEGDWKKYQQLIILTQLQQKSSNSKMV